jgi:predicted phage tail protein
VVVPLQRLRARNGYVPATCARHGRATVGHRRVVLNNSNATFLNTRMQLRVVFCPVCEECVSTRRQSLVRAVIAVAAAMSAALLAVMGASGGWLVALTLASLALMGVTVYLAAKARWSEILNVAPTDWQFSAVRFGQGDVEQH